MNWRLTIQVEPLFNTGNIYYNYYVYTNNNYAIQQNIFMHSRTLILQFRALPHSITDCKQWRNRRNLTQLYCVHALLTKPVNNKHGRLSTITTIIIIILITAHVDIVYRTHIGISGLQPRLFTPSGSLTLDTPLFRDQSSHTAPRNWTSINVNIISTTKFVRDDVKWDLYVTLIS